MKIIYLGLPGTGYYRPILFAISFHILGKHKCAWTLDLLGIDVVHDYNKNEVVERRQPRSMQCMMDSSSVISWEEAG